MKSIYLHCPLLSGSDYRTVLEKLCPKAVQNVTVYTHADRVSSKALAELITVQKDFGMERSVRFRNILVLSGIPRFTKDLRKALLKNNITVDLQVTPAQAPKLGKPVRELAKRGITCKLWVDETEHQAAVYDQFRSHGLYLNFVKPRYTAETADQFSNWLYDPAAQGINTYCDIITMLTLDTYSPNCRYASCFGTTFRVDEQLQVYLCPRHMDRRTCLGQLTDRDTLLQCDAVAKLLTDAVKKRSACSESCRGFSVCQGGCILEPEAHDECIHYIETVDRVQKALSDVYRNDKLKLVNPIVKNAILNALAFGSAFFK